MNEQQNPFAGWFVLELMGHRRLAGYVTEQTIAGAGFLRIDVPRDDSKCVTQFYPPSAVYCMTPTSEETARAVARTSQPRPVERWELLTEPRAGNQRDHYAYGAIDADQDEHEDEQDQSEGATT